MDEPIGLTPRQAFPKHISKSWLISWGVNYAGFVVKAASEAILESPFPTKWTFDRKKRKAAEYRRFLIVELWKHYSVMK